MGPDRWMRMSAYRIKLPKPSKRMLSSPDPNVAAYSLMRKNIFHDRWVRRCGWWPDRVIRLVDKTRGSYSDDLVHEQWVAYGPMKEISLAIEHYSFRNYADIIDKLQNYSTLAAHQMNQEGRSRFLVDANLAWYMDVHSNVCFGVGNTGRIRRVHDLNTQCRRIPYEICQASGTGFVGSIKRANRSLWLACFFFFPDIQDCRSRCVE
jgi:hypothetical protein